MATLTFHSMAGSAYLWTAMMAADEKGVDYDFVHLELGSPEHLRLHPFGKMPVMQHGEAFLYETLAITHYIDHAFEGPPLLPPDPLSQAQAMRWISVVNAYVFTVMNRFMKERLVRPAWGFARDEAFLQSARAPLELQMRLIGEAARVGGYLVGDRLTLADCYLLPHLLFFGRTPEGEALLQASPDVADWLWRMTTRPSYAVSPMKETFEAFSSYPAPTDTIWAPG